MLSLHTERVPGGRVRLPGQFEGESVQSWAARAADARTYALQAVARSLVLHRPPGQCPRFELIRPELVSGPCEVSVLAPFLGISQRIAGGNKNKSCWRLAS